jgi:hypothetical protein
MTMKKQEDGAVILDGTGVSGLYPVAEAAKRVGMTYAALDSAVRRYPGRVTVYKVGRERLLRLTELVAYFQNPAGLPAPTER